MADPSIPDLGGLSLDEYVHRNTSPSAIQPPTAAAPSQDFLSRYGSAAARGAAWNVPGAIVTGATGVGIPLAVGELAVGALGGVAGQAAQDLGAPAWVGDAIGTAAGLGAGGISTVGRGLYSIGSRLAAHPQGIPGHLLYGAAIGWGEHLAANILGGAMHVSSDAGTLLVHGAAAAATFGGAAVAAGTKNLLRPFATNTGIPYTNQMVRDWALPFSGFIGAELGPEGPSASAPISPPRKSTLELNPDQPAPPIR